MLVTAGLGGGLGLWSVAVDVVIDHGQRIRVHLADRVEEVLHTAQGGGVAAWASGIRRALTGGGAESLGEGMKTGG